jgi:hypothetical protein
LQVSEKKEKNHKKTFYERNITDQEILRKCSIARVNKSKHA